MTVSRPAVVEYAEALFGAASGRGELERVREDLNGLVRLAAEEPLFVRSLDSPLFPRKPKLELLAAVTEGMSPLVVNLMPILSRRIRTRLLPEIARLFSHMADLCCGVLTAEVVSAIPLSGSLETRLGEALRSRFGRAVRVEKKVDPSVVGGLLVRIAGRRMDATVRGGLERIRRTMLERKDSVVQG